MRGNGRARDRVQPARVHDTRQLGIKLRQLRVNAGKSHADVVNAKIASRAKINRIESGKLPVKVSDVRTLCWLYGADDATTDALAALAPGTDADDWWEQYGQAVPGWFNLYAGLEATASRIRCFDAEVIPGLVQTAEYAALVIGEDDPRLAADVVEQRVQLRMRRQQSVLDTLPSVQFILTESALLFGRPAILAAQLDHLRSVTTRSNIDVRVLPFSAETYPRRGSFILLDFEHDDDPSVVYVEVPKGARYFDRPEDRAEYEYVFEIIMGKSIPIGEWKR